MGMLETAETSGAVVEKLSVMEKVEKLSGMATVEKLGFVSYLET